MTNRLGGVPIALLLALGAVLALAGCGPGEAAPVSDTGGGSGTETATSEDRADGQLGPFALAELPKVAEEFVLSAAAAADPASILEEDTTYVVVGRIQSTNDNFYTLTLTDCAEKPADDAAVPALGSDESADDADG